MIPKLETTKPYLFNLLCKKTKTKKQIKTIIIAVKKEKKIEEAMPAVASFSSGYLEITFKLVELVKALFSLWSEFC